jgi:L-asparagine transporter-like permease
VLLTIWLGVVGAVLLLVLMALVRKRHARWLVGTAIWLAILVVLWFTRRFGDPGA